MNEKEQPVDSILLAISKESRVFERAELKEQLVFYINHLLLNDFNRLVQLLYTVDVDENKLKGYLSENRDEDAAVLITDMLIARQELKQKQRKETTPGEDIAEDEKW